ncbi:MAG: type II toxin-antitoxin system ParD family antitoxin [Cyanobacteria bacterium P01_F01_bin.150]
MEISFTLPPELEEFVATQVDGGHYESANDVIVASLQLLLQRQNKNFDNQGYVPKSPLGQKLQAIRQRAIDSGMVTTSAEEIAAELKTQRNSTWDNENLS